MAPAAPPKEAPKETEDPESYYDEEESEESEVEIVAPKTVAK